MKIFHHLKKTKKFQTLRKYNKEIFQPHGGFQTFKEKILKPLPKKEPGYLKKYSDGEIIDLLKTHELKLHQIETALHDNVRAVKIRRAFLALEFQKETSGEKNPQNGTSSSSVFKDLPFENYDYNEIFGVCCEQVVGYVQLPVGIVGPLKIDDETYMIPLATTEGCLVASTQRGVNALMAGNGVSSVIINDGITRGPVLKFENAKRAGAFKKWVEENYELVEHQFNATSNYAKLQDIKIAIAGRTVFIRFKCTSGDAMGMNMVTKGVSKAMQFLREQFNDFHLLSLSGNFCVDKKPSAVNWIEGRGKSVISDAVIPKKVVKDILKTSVDAMVDLAINKNLVGSAMAGSIGGFNAHASNLVTALYIATGQDVAQNVESSQCITLMEKNENGDLYMSCSMPSIEVGTIGGGTGLRSQAACLDIIGIKGSDSKNPGKNAKILSRVVCSTVLAGELSLMAALCSGDLLKSHMKLNRRK